MDEEQGYVVLEEIERKGMLLLLTFSNGFEVRATRGTVKKLELTEGFEFSPTGFREVKTLLLERFALYCAESLLARRNYSVGEFKERLRQKEIGLDMIKRIVAEFRRLDLLDDYRYGQMRVRSVIRRKPAGRGFLIADLQKRLVPRDIAEKVVTEALKDSDEIEMAVELLEKRRAAFTKFDLETKRRKAYTYLSRRAISYGASKAAFDMVFGKTQK